MIGLSEFEASDGSTVFEMSLAPGVFPNKPFYSAEEAFYAHKAMRSGDVIALCEILEAGQPDFAAIAAPPNWGAIRHEIMYAVLAARISQDKGLRARLLATDDAPIDLTCPELPCYGLLLELLRTKLRMIDDGAFISVTWADDHLAVDVLKHIGRAILH